MTVKKCHWMPAIVIALLGIAPISFLSADDALPSYDNVKKETREFLSSVKNYSADKKDELVKNTQQTLDKLDKNIEELDQAMEENWDGLSQSARNKYLEEKRVLKQFRGDVAQTYTHLKGSSEDTWDKTRQQFSKAMDKFYNAWEDTIDSLEKDNREAGGG